eukprot:2914283-Pyramimonas_sp.AAC.1
MARQPVNPLVMLESVPDPSEFALQLDRETLQHLCGPHVLQEASPAGPRPQLGDIRLIVL